MFGGWGRPACPQWSERLTAAGAVRALHINVEVGKKTPTSDMLLATITDDDKNTRENETEYSTKLYLCVCVFL